MEYKNKVEKYKNKNIHKEVFKCDKKKDEKGFEVDIVVFYGISA